MKIMKWLVVLLAIFLAACQPASPTPTAPVQVLPTSSPVATPAIEPTAKALPAGEGYPAAQEPSSSSARLDMLFSGGYPAPGLDVKAIPWDEAKAQILDGKVMEVLQLHNLTVTMKLTDGTILQSVEPVLDEVFTVIDQCGEKCANIIKASQ